MSDRALQVQEALKRCGVTCRVKEFPASTKTAQEAASAIGCSVAQIAKSIVLKTKNTNEAVLVITSGSNRVNERAVSTIIGQEIEKANADFVREKTGFAIGGIPPLGHAQPLITLIDQDLLKFDRIYAAAGTPQSVFELTPAELIVIAPTAKIASVI